MKYKIQWRLPLDICDCEEWKDINGESYHVQEHAELRKSAYWEKEIPVLEWRVIEEP